MPVTPPPPGLTEDDYERIEAAVMETARGRWFLTEFARRVREGESQRMLDAIARIERLVEIAIAPAAERTPALPPASPPPVLAAPEAGRPSPREPSPLLARIEPLARSPEAAPVQPVSSVDPTAAFAALAAMSFRDRLAFFA